MRSNVYKCPQQTSVLTDDEGKKVEVKTGPYRSHLFNQGIRNKKDAHCMRCGVKR
jgi:hypothetical protein